MTNSDRPGSSGPGGGSSHRKRNYRHFGPPSSSGQQGQPVQRRDPGVQQQQRNQNQPTANPPSPQGNKPQRPGGPPIQQRRSQPGPQGNKPAQYHAQAGIPSGQEQHGGQAAVRKPAQPQRPKQDPAVKREPREVRNVPQQHARPEPTTQHQPGGAPAQERNNRWERRIKAEETFDDIKRDNERIEKEIWLEIAGIHSLKIDL